MVKVRTSLNSRGVGQVVKGTDQHMDFGQPHTFCVEFRLGLIGDWE